jgi:hypothetical protein
MPSDDEEEDEEVYSSDNNSDQESLKKSKKVALTSNKVKSNIPLPSDEEDNTGTLSLIYSELSPGN